MRKVKIAESAKINVFRMFFVILNKFNVSLKEAAASVEFFSYSFFEILTMTTK